MEDWQGLLILVGAAHVPINFPKLMPITLAASITNPAGNCYSVTIVQRCVFVANSIGFSLKRLKYKQYAPRREKGLG